MTAAEKIPPPAAETKTRTALIAEDDQEFSNLMCEFLLRQGFDVKQCYDGTQASNLIRSTKFDLIILDIRMPGIHGMRVAALARSSSVNRSTNIFMVTGEQDPSFKIIAEGLKIRNFLTKPVDFSAFEAALKAQSAKSENKVSYDIRVINCFIQAAADVYEFYFNEKPQRGKVQVRQPGKPEKGFCTGLIALNGDGFSGSMGLSMTAPFIKTLAANLFDGLDVKFDNEFISDVTGEMCNQVLGKVKLNFAKLGIKVNIGLPEVIMGKNHIIQHKVDNPVICLAMGRDKMVFELQFVLSQNDVKFEQPEKADIPPADLIFFE